MPPRLRKFALVLHVTASVGWVGAVAASLALGVAGLTSHDSHLVRSSYFALEFMGWFVLVPFSIVSLVTGVAQSVGTTWGLFRHYWVLFKLLINVFASVVLLLYTRSLGYMANLATGPADADPSALRSPSVVLHAGAALMLLLAAVVLSVYKPAGLTPYGQRMQRASRQKPRLGGAEWHCAIPPEVSRAAATVDPDGRSARFSTPP